MKKLWVMLLTLVLTLSAFTACGCTPQDMNGTMEPTRATTPATIAPTIPEPATDGNETGVVGSEEPTTGSDEATSGAGDATDPMRRRSGMGRGMR